MLVDLALTPFVFLAAVLFLISALCSLGAGYFALTRLCRWATGRLPDFMQGGLIENVIERISHSAAFQHEWVQNIEKIQYAGAAVGLLLFGSQIAMFIAYGAMFMAIVGVLWATKALDGNLFGDGVDVIAVS